MTSNETRAQTARNCPRCGTPLCGTFCLHCGLRADGFFATATQQPSVSPAKLSYKVRWGLLGAALCFVLLLGSCTALLLFSTPLRRDFALQPPGSDAPSGGYQAFPGFCNENETTRIEPLGTRRSNGSEAFPAPEGKEYLIVNLRITNLSGDILPYDSSYFELCNTSGNLVPVQYTDLDAATALSYGRLLPHGVAEGSLVFLVRKDDISLVLYLENGSATIHFPLV